MLNPEFVKKMQAKLAPIVQGGGDAERERALKLLAERYADRIASPEFWGEERWILRDSWFQAGEGLPSFEIHAEIQRNYLIALDPSAESKIDNMGSLLSTDLWVEAAAFDLAPGVRERIAKEIEAHYDDALEEELCSGKGRVRAHLDALNRLGDPWAAAKIFRKTYLTAQEGREISMLMNPPTVLMTGRLGVILNVSFLLSFLLMSEPIKWYLFLASLALGHFINSRIVPPLIRINKGRGAYMWVMVSAVFMLAATWGVIVSSDFMQELGASVLSVLFTAMLAFIVYGAFLYSFLLRKRLPFPDRE